MANSLIEKPASASIRMIVLDALRAAVHARSEREGFDLLAESLSLVAQVARGGDAAGGYPYGGSPK